MPDPGHLRRLAPRAGQGDSDPRKDAQIPFDISWGPGWLLLSQKKWTEAASGGGLGARSEWSRPIGSRSGRNTRGKTSWCSDLNAEMAKLKAPFFHKCPSFHAG